MCQLFKIVYCAEELIISIKANKQFANWRDLREIGMAWIRIPTLPLMITLGKLFNVFELQLD